MEPYTGGRLCAVYDESHLARRVSHGQHEGSDSVIVWAGRLELLLKRRQLGARLKRERSETEGQHEKNLKELGRLCNGFP